MFKTSLSRVLFVRTQIRGRGVVFATLFITAALLVLGAIATLQNHQATAAPTSSLNFQARLKQSSGALVPDGYYHVEFKLYNQSSTGSALWTETYTGGSRVRVVNGYVSVSLGSVTPFPGTIDWGEEHWITMNVGGSGGSPTWDGEMSPRLKLTAVPYAFKAAEAGSLKTTQGANQSTLGWATQTQSRTLTLPDESGVLCVQNSTACGFAPATGGTGYIQNGTVQQPATSFNIDGTGTATTLNATTAIQLNGADINEAGTLTNVAYLNAVTTFRAVTNDTNAFRVQNSAGGTILNVDTLGSTVSIGQSSTSDVFTALANPAALPNNTGQDAAWSSDGQYMAVAHFGTTPRLTIYKRSGDTFTKLANPATIPAGPAYGVAWSPDTQYLSVAHQTSPYITIYKRSGDTFTKLTNPVSLPSATIAYSTAWSPDGQYVSVGTNSTPFIYTYKRSGDVFTRITDPNVTPTGAVRGIEWSPDGQYMSTAHLTSPYITIYKRSGDTFTKLADPAITPGGTAYSTAWSNNGLYLAVVSATTTPRVVIYERSGDVFTAITNLPAGGTTNYDVDWSPDGNFLAISTSAPPYVLIYQRGIDSAGQTTFTQLSNPATLPTGAGNGLAFSADNQYLSVAHNTSPYITTYKIGNGQSTSLSVQGNAHFAGQVIANSLTANAFSANAATFGSLVTNNAAVQSGAVSSTLTVGKSIVLASDNTNPGLLQLGSMAGMSDPAGGSNGAMYYNTTLEEFRCFRAGAWENCGSSATTTTSFAQNGNALGETAILGTTDNYGLQLITNGTQVANFTSAGDIIFTPGETFEIKNSTNTTVLGVNTTDNTIDLNADVATTGSMSITNGLTVAGNASFDSNLTVAGTTTMTNNLTVQNEDDENILNVNTATGVVTVGEANTLTWDGEVGILSAAVDVQPGGAARSAAWSEGGQYLAVAHTASPYVSIYKRSGNTFTKLADPAILPTGASYGVAWSPDGAYLSVTHNTSPRLTIYKRSGDTFTKLANPAVIPSSNAYNSAWSGDGRYLAVTISASPDNLIIYKRSGDTFTKLANPAAVLLGNGRGVSFSPDSTYMVYTTASGADGERMIIYKRSGDTFTKLADPSGIPSSASTAWSATWSGDGAYLNVSHYGSPYLTTYKRSGDTFTKLADPSSLPTTGATTSAFSPSGQYLAVGNTWTPYFSMYKRSGDTFTKLPNPGTLPQSQVLGVAFSGDNNYVAVVGDGGAGNTADQRLRIYKSGGENGEVAGNLIIGGTTTTDSLLIGNPASASLAGAKLVVTTAEIQTSLRLGNATSGISWNDITTGSGGGKLRLYGDARNVRKVTLSPEYPNVTISGTAPGTLQSGYHAGTNSNYYSWSSGTYGQRDIVIKYRLPDDWNGWGDSTPICVRSAVDAYPGPSLVQARITDGTGGEDIDSYLNNSAILPANQWGTTCLALDSDYAAGDLITLRFTLITGGSYSAYLGDITLTYLSSF